MKRHYFSNKLYNGCYRIKLWLCSNYYHLRNILRLNSTGVIYNKDLITNGKLIISNCGSMTIGKGCCINSASYPNPVGTSNSRLYTYDSKSKLIIGDNVGLSNVLIFAKDEIVIENDVMIGAETMIIDNDFHSVNVHIDSEGKSIREPGKASPICISQGAFIGARCIILKGIRIGKNSVIGAGSVVTKNVPDNEVWAGNPARYIGHT